jgi:dolichyl-phosphate beta-glucosyltransferase
MSKLSIVIPAYNEQRRIGRALAIVRDHAERAGRAIELIVVDDGSTDGTRRIVESFDPGPVALRLIPLERNHGKGHAVRRGMLQATGELRLMSDADFSTPLSELAKLEPWIERGFDIVIASRSLPDSILDPPQPWHRRLMGRGMILLRGSMMLRGLRDTQCGFKLFTAAAAGRLFAMQTIDGFAFDVEVLAIAERLGMRIKEIGVIWRDDRESKVRPILDSVRVVRALFEIRRRVARIDQRT